MKTFYFAHSFTGAAPEYLARVADIEQRIVAASGWSRLQHFSENGRRYDPDAHRGQLFATDIKHGVAECDALILESSYSTTGGGFECGIAAALGKPVLILASHSPGSSALIYDAAHGIATAHFGGRFTFKQYGDPADAVIIACEFLAQIP